MSLVPQIPPYQQPEGIVTSNRSLYTVRPAGGRSTYQAEEQAIQRARKGMDAIIESLWCSKSIWEIGDALWAARIDVSARQIWGAKQRLDAEKREAQK